MIYGKKNGGHRAFKRVKISAKFSKRLSICTVTPLRDITEKIWVHSYPIMSRSILVEITCTISIVFTFVVCDALRVRDMREKMRSSNGRERPNKCIKIQVFGVREEASAIRSYHGHACLIVSLKCLRKSTFTRLPNDNMLRELHWCYRAKSQVNLQQLTREKGDSHVRHVKMFGMYYGADITKT